VATYDLIADLPVVIESYDLEGRELDTGNADPRMTTLIHLRGAGEEGVGEDVIYDGLDHVNFQAAGQVLPLTGEWTIASLSDRLEELDLFPDPPVRELSRSFRRWAFESAALDLALRQAGKPLHEVVGREARPVNFVVSMRLGGPPSLERFQKICDGHPNLMFKLDPTNSWTPELIAELAASGRIDSLDLKGHYRGTPVDVETDPELYKLLAESFPTAWIEDPDLSVAEADEVLEPHRDRITWDAPIHSVEDIDALPFAPKTINIKPSRFGPLKALFRAYDVCEERGIGAYGGGQTELGCGRGHIQYLASVFHPDTPNDVAPRGYNQPDLPDGLPDTPLASAPASTGFRWDADY
jgi:L-alanine-DL-glutamate epimerase-like enolase superfamily enzyme